MKSLLVITGPSGIGKTYLAEQLIRKHPHAFTVVKVYTTRVARSGEAATDRIFTSNEEFKVRQGDDEFFIADSFHDHSYGWPKKALQTTNRHLITNVWPALLPEFSKQPNVCIVGLTTDASAYELLKKRMLQRGDTEPHINERLEIIKLDIQDIQLHTELIHRFGKLFSVIDDQTIPQEVIPWIEARLDIDNK